MKTTHSTLAGMSAALVLALLFVPLSLAQCGGVRLPSPTHTNWHPQFGKAQLVRAALGNGGSTESAAPSIVGFWHVKFVSDGVTTGIPPGVITKGMEIDAGYSQWHSDGTEFMNSAGRAPNTSAVCLGVWEAIGPNKYLLNHFAAGWDPTKGAVGPAGPAGELIGPTQIREEVTLAENGESFSGPFTIDNFDESGTHLSHLEGTITGTRIHPNTPPSSIF
jgi:hypothetical protein